MPRDERAQIGRLELETRGFAGAEVELDEHLLVAASAKDNGLAQLGRLQQMEVCRIVQNGPGSGQLELGALRHLCAKVVRGPVLVSEGSSWTLVPDGGAFVARGWSRIHWKSGARGAEFGHVTLAREDCPLLWTADGVELRVRADGTGLPPTNDGPAIVAFFSECLMRLKTEPSPTGDEALSKVLAAVRAQPTGDWRLERAARLAGYSPSQFARLWKREVGCSFAEHVVAERTMKACEILSETTLEVGQVAVYAGFPDAQSLRRALMEETGFKPADFRKPNPDDGEPIARRRP